MNEQLRRSILKLSKAQRGTLYRMLMARGVATPLVEAPGRLLAAWIVPHKEGIDLGELRTFLAGLLPGHMVPEAFEVREKLPLTPAGKVDRQALLREGRVAPRKRSGGSVLNTPMEALLGQIWCEVMEIHRVGRHDNFFDLGGHSLMALRLIAKLSKAVQSDLSVRFLFENPTIQLQAMELERQRASLPPSVTTSIVRGEHVRTNTLILKVRPDDCAIEAECGVVDAVALGYLSSEMARVMGWSVEEMMSRWFVSGGPVVDGVIETQWGRIGGITLPYLDATLYDDREGLVNNIILALNMAKRLGARVVTMTGLIPSATEYGNAVVRAVAAAGRGNLPTISTGHATTSAAVVLNIQRMIEVCERNLSSERVAFVGLGSIGVSSLRLMLACMPHPREIILCDVYARLNRLCEIRDELLNDCQFRGTVTLAPARGEIPPNVYRASLIVGATNVPDVVEIERVMPGTMIVDDSAPHCFSVSAAIKRLQNRADIVFSEAGLMSLPKPIHEIAYYPEGIASTTGVSRFTASLCHDAESITGCVISGLLSAHFGLIPTLGSVTYNESLIQYSTLKNLGTSGGRLQCDAYCISNHQLDRFRSAFSNNA